MEIEAKFTIPNRQVYRDFLRLRTLAGFTLLPAGTLDVTDHYVDTADARLLAAGYACRLRNDGASVLVSLKGLGGATGAIHHRDEQEVQLPGLSLDVQAWPPGAARDLALTLTGGAPLQPLFDLEQHRVRADVVAAAPEAGRPVAQLSLDEVRAAVGRRPAFYYELEVELTGEGTEADLARMADELAATYHLTPEPRSKFERGLATLRSRGAAVETRLAEPERAALQEWARHPDAEEAHRAAAILAWSEGLPTRDIVARSGLSAGRVRFWVRAFRERRMGVFEADEGRTGDAGRTGDGGRTGGEGRTGSEGKRKNKRRTEDEARLAAGIEPGDAPASGAPTPGGATPAAGVQPADKGWEPPRPDEPMSEAGRKLLLLHLGRMLANEEGTRAGEDIEALHDMRVATRRMRAAYGIFAEYFDSAQLKRFRKGLQRTGRALGTVRDLDVLIDKAEAHRAGLTPELLDLPDDTEGRRSDCEGKRSDSGIGPLVDDWHARRAAARQQMLDYLDSRSYRTFVADFGAFLATPGAGALTFPRDQPVPYQVRHVVPRLIFTRYEAVRAYEPVIAEAPLPTYHLLRIDCKRLRYALEFFRDVLGPEAPGLIQQVTAMQDLLGALQDAYVAEGLIGEFLHNRPKGKKKKPASALPGVEQYLAVQRNVQQELVAQFPPPWAQLTGRKFRRSLALAVAAL